MSEQPNTQPQGGDTPPQKPKRSVFDIVRMVSCALCALVTLVCVVWLLVWYLIPQLKARAAEDELKKLAFSASSSSSSSSAVSVSEEAVSSSAPTVVNPIDFAALQAKNSDIYAWITIPGTTIDNPVLQNADYTDYYLDYTVDKVRGLPGAIYTRNDTPQDFSAPCTVMYGHNMEDDKTMFSTLHRFTNSEFFWDDEHRTVQIYTPTSALEYRVFAAVRFRDVLLPAAFNFNAENGAGVLAFVDELKTRPGFYDDDVTIDADSKLLVMSTCLYRSENAADQRLLVVAVLESQQETVPQGA
jgi:sortase B